MQPPRARGKWPKYGGSLFGEVKSEWCGLIGTWASGLNRECGLIIG